MAIEYTVNIYSICYCVTPLDFRHLLGCRSGQAPKMIDCPDGQSFLRACTSAAGERRLACALLLPAAAYIGYCRQDRRGDSHCRGRLSSWMADKSLNQQANPQHLPSGVADQADRMNDAS